MNEQEDENRRRDELLLKLLKTPPQPRPKHERGENGSKDKAKSSRKAS